MKLDHVVKIPKEIPDVSKHVLTQEAVAFLVKLHREFEKRRQERLQERERKLNERAKGHKFSFVKPEADPSWTVAKTPKDLEKRWVEITGPTDRKMVINALNCGADTFMADFEDSNSPTWQNMIEGQLSLQEAVRGTLSFTSEAGKRYTLNEKRATLLMRPRGFHLVEKHFMVDQEPISASLFDFGLYFFHNAKTLIEKGSGPYFYLPKMESHLEARLWNDIFLFAQKELGIDSGTIRATVLIETLPAAFEMEAILYELRAHASGLNAGRWDYIFSIIKTCAFDSNFLLPDRKQITMGVPFMEAYCKLLVRTCHSHGAHAIGGMAAYVPSRNNSLMNEVAFKKVKTDKEREVRIGFDGTWVAHPDLVSCAEEVFSKALEQKPSQRTRPLDTSSITEDMLTDFHIERGKITEEGVRQNISIALQYLSHWLDGKGAVALFNLMEDVATAEISRAQLWQWVHNKAKLDDGRKVDPFFYDQLLQEEVKSLKASALLPQIEVAKKLLNHLVLSETFIPFLTWPGYELIS